jgi:hypothetical protein
VEENKLKQAWDDFKAGLHPDERSRLETQGITGPIKRPYEESKGSDLMFEAARRDSGMMAQVDRDEALEMLDSVIEVLSEEEIIERLDSGRRAHAAAAVQSALRLVLCELFTRKKVNLELSCLARAIEFPMGQEGTVREIARRSGCSFQNVHAKETAWRKRLGLPRASHQKSPKSSKAYSRSNRRNRNLNNVPRETK